MIDEILRPYHSNNCHSSQSWIKGMTEPFPCDCSIAQALTAIYEIGLEVIGETEPQLDRDDPAYDHEEAVDKETRNELRASQRKAWAELLGVAE